MQGAMPPDTTQRCVRNSEARTLGVGGHARGWEAPTCSAGYTALADCCPQLFSSKTSACRLPFPHLPRQTVRRTLGALEIALVQLSVRFV